MSEGKKFFKREATEAMDNIVLDAIGKDEYVDFDEYARDMLELRMGD